MKKILLLGAFLLSTTGVFAQWTEDFDSSTTLPEGWAVINQGDTETFGIGAIPFISGGASAHSGTNVAKIKYTDEAHDDYLITKAINVQSFVSDRITFYVRSSNDSYFDEYSVLLSTTDQTAEAFTVTLQETQEAPNAWVEKSFSLSDYEGQTVYVAIHATSTDQYYLLLDSFVVDGIPSCATPTGLSASNITTNSAKISWSASTSVVNESYVVYYSTENTPPTEDTVLNNTNSVTVAATDTEAILSNLEANDTTYYAWVKANCSDTDSSEWSNDYATFNTLCEVATNVSEDFNGTSANQLPNCWSKLTTGINANAYVDATSSMETNVLYIYSASGTDQAIVKMPPLSNLSTGNYRLKFTGRGAYDGGGNIEVGYMTDGEDASTFTVIGTYTATSGTQLDYYVLNITGVPAGVETLALKHSGGYSVYVDDVVYEEIPSCIEASSLSSSNVASNSAEISWTASSSTVEGYTVYYSTENTAPTEGIDLTDENSVTVTGTETTATLSNLLENTIYYAWVRANCSDTESSEWSLNTSFNTLCTTATDTPYIMNFDNLPSTNVGACETVINYGEGNQWEVASSATGYTGKVLNYKYHGSHEGDTWFFTRGLNLQANTEYLVKFKYGNNSPSYTEKMKVAYGTDRTADAMVHEIVDFPSINDAMPHEVEYVITPTETGVYYVGFYAYSGINQYRLYLDDIMIMENTNTGTISQELPNLQVYPNPATDIITIANDKSIDAVEVYDINGRRVLHTKVEQTSTTIQVDNLAKGTYFIRVSAGDKISTKQVIVK